jgi:fructokinase
MTRRVFGIGETVYDIIFKGTQPIAAKPGGSVLNALVSLARMGHEVHYISEIGDDAISDQIIDFLQANKVGQRYLTRYPSGQTPLALAFLNQQNDATYAFYKTLPPDRSINLPNNLTANDIVIFGSFFAISPLVRPFVHQFIAQAKEVGATIVYDPNFRQGHNHDNLVETVKENMSMASIVRGSDEDFMNILGSDNISDTYEQCKLLCKNIVVTANSKNIEVRTPNVVFESTVREIKPLSTIGAGDNFNAGIIKAILDMGITNNDIDGLNADQWMMIVEYGKAFSGAVCQSIDNYVDEGFGERLPYILGLKELSYNWDGNSIR